MPSKVNKYRDNNTRTRVVKKVISKMLHCAKTIQTSKRVQSVNSIYLLALKRKLILLCQENIITICLIEAAVQTIE
jgi:hypothetical protein